MLLTQSVFLLLILAAPEASQDTPHDEFRDYRALLEQARNSRPSGVVGVITLSDETSVVSSPNRLQEVRTIVQRRTERLESLVMMDNTIGKVFPGGLMWTQPIYDGRLEEVEQIDQRPSITVAVSGPTLDQASGVHGGTYSDFQGAVAPMIASIDSAPIRMRSDYKVAAGLEEALMDIGLSANYWKIRIKSSLQSARSESHSFAILSLDQVYYSISADAPPSGGYLPDALVQNDPQLCRSLIEGIKRNGELAYVRKVDYGRRLMIVLSADVETEKLRRAIKVTVDAVTSGGEASFTDEVKQTWAQVEGQLLLIGGKYPDGVGDLFSGTPDAFVKTVQAVMKRENVTYSPQEGGVPISFELAYLSDGSPMQVFETAEFAGKIPGRSWGRVVREQQIRTTGNDARVTRQDDEIDSDDWTKVSIDSQVLRLSGDRRTVYFDLVWRAFEAESDQRIRNKTIIESRKTFPFHETRAIKDLISTTSFGTKEQWYRGKVHRPVPFANHGLLSNIRVQFDAKGRHDDRIQQLTATLRFELWLEE